MHILVLDEDHFANTLVQFILAKEGYEVETVDNPRNAFQMIQRREPDLLILDATLPYMNGFEFAAKLRAESYEIPLIFMTTQNTIEAKLEGFRVGAEDYICKPYNHQELVARVQAIMFHVGKGKKMNSQNKRSLCVGNIEFFPKALKVIVKGKPITLTRTEAQVLSVLMNNPDKSVKREQILMEVWNDDSCTTNIVDVYIRRLRAKIEYGLDKPKYITSKRGLGYKLTGE